LGLTACAAPGGRCGQPRSLLLFPRTCNARSGVGPNSWCPLTEFEMLFLRDHEGVRNGRSGPSRSLAESSCSFDGSKMTIPSPDSRCTHRAEQAEQVSQLSEIRMNSLLPQTGHSIGPPPDRGTGPEPASTGRFLTCLSPFPGPLDGLRVAPDARATKSGRAIRPNDQSASGRAPFDCSPSASVGCGLRHSCHRETRFPSAPGPVSGGD
jgi:hypothetical protein